MDNDNYVNAPIVEEQPESGKATASMVCGIVGACLCGCMPLGVAALILAIMAKKAGNTSGKATAGLILGIVVLVVWLVSQIIMISTGYYTNLMDQLS